MTAIKLAMTVFSLVKGNSWAWGGGGQAHRGLPAEVCPEERAARAQWQAGARVDLGIRSYGGADADLYTPHHEDRLRGVDNHSIMR